MKRIALLAAVLTAPTMATAAIDIGKGLACEMPATEFFRPFVQRKLINIGTYRLEDSISYYQPIEKNLSHPKGGMLAFGMKVDTVFGYARGQLMFERGPGTEPSDTYGVIVKEGIANVQAQLNSVGANRAQTRRISSTRTAIICEGV